MHSQLHHLRHRTESSRRLLEEALAQQKEAQRAIDNFIHNEQALRIRPFPEWWNDYGFDDISFDTRSFFQAVQAPADLRDTLRDCKNKVDACAQSYGTAVCNELAEVMFEAIPRELRDIVYHALLQDAHPMTLPHNEDEVEQSNMGLERFMGVFNACGATNKGKLNTPLDYRFAFFKRHYFQVSYMGLGFVREIIDTHFRKTPFRIQHEELFSRRGHQDFFLTDKFGLGCPLGHLLSRVEVTISSLDHKIRDTLQPLMAIGNTDCEIELTSPKQLVIPGDFGREDIPVSPEVFLDRIALNSSKPSRLINRPKAKLHKEQPISRVLTTEAHISQPQKKARDCSRSVFGRRPMRPETCQNRRGCVPNKDRIVPSKPATLQPTGSQSKLSPKAAAQTDVRVSASVPPKCSLALNQATILPDVKCRLGNTTVSTTAADHAGVKRKMHEGEQSTEDIKAFYENRRAEVRALLAARQ
ncbi:Nn.00g069990.m01.CDS01 [Neocucurbitaria sp. VM-36]